MDPVLSHHTSQEKQPAAVPELPNNKPHQSPNQSHAEDHTEQIEATSGEDHRRRTGRVQSRKEYHVQSRSSTYAFYVRIIFLAPASVVCHQLGLLGTDLHAVGCGGFVKTLT